MIDGSEWIGFFPAVCSRSNEWQFHSSDEVYAELGVGEHLAGVDYFCLGDFSRSADVVNGARFGPGLCEDWRRTGPAGGRVWCGLGHFAGLPGTGSGWNRNGTI